jgi:hypothetical protein
MSEISDALPVTPVTMVASIFTKHPVLTDDAMLREIETVRAEWGERAWLLREKTPQELWKAAKQVLQLRHLIVPVDQWRDELFEDRGGMPEIDDAWGWNPRQILLRDYYANALLTYDEVKQRGWPERKPRATVAVPAAIEPQVSPGSPPGA